MNFSQRLLYQCGSMRSKVGLLQGQTVLEDDQKLSEYSLPEGATISALFEPDADINVEVTMGQEMQNIMCVNELK